MLRKKQDTAIVRIKACVPRSQQHARLESQGTYKSLQCTSSITSTNWVSSLHKSKRNSTLTLILQLPPMLMPPPPCDIPVLDAIGALPVAVAMPAIPDIAVMAIDVTELIISCPEWSIITWLSDEKVN